MKCTKCGYENDTGSKYCANCGEILAIENCGNKSNKSTAVLIVGIVLIVLAVVVIISAMAFVYYNSNTNNERVVISQQSSTVGSEPDDEPSGESENSETSEHGEQSNQHDIVTHEEPEQNENAVVPNENPQIVVPEEKPDSVAPVQPDVYSERDERKNSYLNAAKEIENYSAMYLDTATTQYDINRESAIVFEKWDILLNEIYQYLKVIMLTSDFKNLESDEINWIKEKENAIEQEGAMWAGGSGEPMARNFTGITYTKDRVYYLISLIG